MPRFIVTIVLRSHLIRASAFCAILLSASSLPASAQTSPPLIHGLWVWKSPTVLAAPHAAESLRDFCKSQDISEVYVSISARTEAAEESQLVHLITELHRSNIRVEALLDSGDADEHRKHRDSRLQQVQLIVQVSQKHRAERCEGIHLDVEPQQRPENKGPGNLRFLPDLVETYRAARVVAASAQLTVDADIGRKELEGSAAERRLLLSSLPQFTLMLYELSSPND